MAKRKPNKPVEVENRLTGEKAKIVYDPTKNRTLIMKATETPKVEKTEKTEPPKSKDKKPTAKAEKIKKSATLSEEEQKVFEFISALDHPANTNEVRDKFGFPLRANARRIFRKLEKLGYGENRKATKGRRKYLFFVKGKEYPKPPEPKKPEKA